MTLTIHGDKREKKRNKGLENMTIKYEIPETLFLQPNFPCAIIIFLKFLELNPGPDNTKFLNPEIK
jgi:hypothetical protein